MAKKTKNNSLDSILDKFNKTYGDGTVTRLDAKPQEVEVISSGSIRLNNALGIQGYPLGRIVEIYGPESSGKTTLAIHAIAECQKTGGTVAFIDAEHAFDRYYAESLGVDSSKLIISQPDNGEQALELVDVLAKSGEVKLIVVDSVAALVPKAEIEGEMGESKMGVHARLMSQAMRKIVGPLEKSGTCCIFINQLRSKIGVMFGSPETTTGGNALKFYASIRIDIRRTGSTKDSKSGEMLTNNVKVKIAKNKLAPPFRIALLEIAFGIGLDKCAELRDLALEFDIFTTNGSWWVYEGNNIAHGKNAMSDMLRDNEDFFKLIHAKVIKHIESI